MPCCFKYIFDCFLAAAKGYRLDPDRLNIQIFSHFYIILAVLDRGNYIMCDLEYGFSRFSLKLQ